MIHNTNRKESWYRNSKANINCSDAPLREPLMLIETAKRWQKLFYIELSNGSLGLEADRGRNLLVFTTSSPSLGSNQLIASVTNFPWIKQPEREAVSPSNAKILVSACCCIDASLDTHVRLQYNTNRSQPLLYFKKVRAFGQQANYTDRATAACRRS
jgi:hypothetical protein